MKKLFTLLTLMLMAVTSAWAGDVFTYTFNGGKEASSPAGFFSHDANGKWSFNAKFKECTYDGKSYSNGLKMEGSTKILFTTTVESIVTIVESDWESNSVPHGTPKTIKFDDEELAIADAEKGTGCYVYTISGVAAGDHNITRGSGESGLFLVKVEYTAEDLTPSLTASPKALAFALTPLATSKSAEFTLTGKNLTDGTYTLDVPAVDGLSVEPASFTVAGGELEETFTVTYATTDEVAQATADITATVDGAEAAVAVTYQSRTTTYEQTIVSEATTWDWTALKETVELTDATTPSKQDEFVFQELEDQVNFGTFDAQSIIISKTQFPVRAGKFQNGTIKFKTSVAGVITVDFSDTGSSGDGVERYLNVNGENTEYYTMRNGSSDRKTTGEIAVEAGEVSITGMAADGETSMAIVVYKLTFEPRDVTTPELTAAPTALSLALTPDASEKSAEFTLTGANLTDGTYTLDVPAVDGLTVSPTSFTVVDGAVSETFTVTYASSENVEETVANITATVDGIDAVVAVTYQSRAVSYEQKAVSEATTWDWTTLSATVELTDATTPSKQDEFVFQELEGQIDFGSFDALSIVISKSQYPSRAGKFQGGTIKFKTTVPGVITVDFSDTGKTVSETTAERYLNVNGENTEYYTMRDGSSSDRKTTGEIAVEAGEVSITGMAEDGTTPQAICIYKITFEPKDEPTGVALRTVEVEQTGLMFNLNGQRLSKAVKGVVIVNGKKVVVK